MEIPKALKDEVWNYCRVNNIPNIDEFVIKLVQQGFTVEKYGAVPESKVIEKIVEKIVEVPVEKIVEKVITNDEETKKLADENTKMVKEIEALKSEIKRLKSIKDIYGE